MPQEVSKLQSRRVAVTHSGLSPCILSMLFIELSGKRLLLRVRLAEEGEISTAHYPAEKTVPRTPTQIIIEAGFSKDNAIRSFPGAVTFQMKFDK